MSKIIRANYPEINEEKCINCGLCQKFCPEGSILLYSDKVIVDLRYCKGCGICANECPVKAIKMVREY